MAVQAWPHGDAAHVAACDAAHAALRNGGQTAVMWARMARLNFGDRPVVMNNRFVVMHGRALIHCVAVTVARVINQLAKNKDRRGSPKYLGDVFF